MKISHKLCGRMDGTQFWCFPWFPANSLLCVIYRYTVYVKNDLNLFKKHFHFTGTFFVIDTFWIWLIFIFTAMPVLLDLLMKKWQNETFSNLGIQYHQSDLLSKHLEILARIIKNKLEIRNQQNRAMTIRQRVRKEKKIRENQITYRSLYFQVMKERLLRIL